MRRRRRTLGETLIRSLAAAGLVYAMVAAVLVAATLLAGPQSAVEGGSALTRSWDHPEWRRAYDARFPGCVDARAWNTQDVPTSVVVVKLSGEVVQMDFDEAYERSRTESRADDVWTVGVCP